MEFLLLVLFGLIMSIQSKELGDRVAEPRGVTFHYPVLHPCPVKRPVKVLQRTKRPPTANPHNYNWEDYVDPESSELASSNEPEPEIITIS